jgi:hypothetical protein
MGGEFADEADALGAERGVIAGEVVGGEEQERRRAAITG